MNLALLSISPGDMCKLHVMRERVDNAALRWSETRRENKGFSREIVLEEEQ